MMTPRPYQEDALNMLDEWFRNHKDKSEYPCLVLPTGAGKSIVIAEYVRRSLAKWPSSRFLILTHQKELIEQDVAKLKTQWPDAPIGIYSASVGQKDLDKQITAASVQSLARVRNLPIFHCVIVDEAHLINNAETGSYRNLFSKMKESYPQMRIIGLTATPYRLGQGMVTDGIFTDLIEPIGVGDLQNQGYLAMLSSKRPDNRYKLDGIGIRQGEYKAEDLDSKLNVYETNIAVCKEIVRRAADRKHWLIFCTTISHAQNIAIILGSMGITATAISSEADRKTREAILDDFVNGRIRAITNVGILTTGFDFPDIDCIVLLRPTMSPGLYYQMVGRGLRLKSDKGNCLVIDFGQNITNHGPITAIKPPKKKGEKGGSGVPPMKVCPSCDEFIPVQTMMCPCCGYVYKTEDKKKSWIDDGADIQGVVTTRKTMEVRAWRWQVEVSKKGTKMLTCIYYPRNLLGQSIKEYFPLMDCHAFARKKSIERLTPLLDVLGLRFSDDLFEVAGDLNGMRHPKAIQYEMDGKYTRIIRSAFNG